MDNLGWDRCPDCLGLLEAVEVANDTAALGCPECGFVGPPTRIPAIKQIDLDCYSFPGF